jgi:hypothetical protein
MSDLDDVPLPVRATIPSLESARAQGLELPDGAPDETHRLAALRVVLHAQFRKGWKDEVSLAAPFVSSLPTEEPKASEVAVARFAILEKVTGQRMCRQCSGRGCGDCKGSGLIADAVVRQVTDTMESFRDVFLPSELKRVPGLMHLESSLEAVVPMEPDPAFECMDLRKVAQESAYRGAQKQQDPKFFGFDFGDTIDVASKTSDEFMSGKGKLLRWRVRAYGWPLLWLRWRAAQLSATPDRDVVLFARPDGTLCRVRSDEPPP